MNVTQATAIDPIGVDHRPRVKGPGTSLFRPDVIRRNIGVVYEVYNPMTEALCESNKLSSKLSVGCCDDSYLAKDVNAAEEKPSSPQIAERNMTSQTAFTGVWVCLFIVFHQREPGNALSRAKAKTTRDASTPCAAPHRNLFGIMMRYARPSGFVKTYLDSDGDTPDRQHTLLAYDVQVDLTHGQRQRRR